MRVGHGLRLAAMAELEGQLEGVAIAVRTSTLSAAAKSAEEPRSRRPPWRARHPRSALLVWCTTPTARGLGSARPRSPQGGPPRGRCFHPAVEARASRSIQAIGAGLLEEFAGASCRPSLAVEADPAVRDKEQLAAGHRNAKRASAMSRSRVWSSCSGHSGLEDQRAPRHVVGIEPRQAQRPAERQIEHEARFPDLRRPANHREATARQHTAADDGWRSAYQSSSSWYSTIVGPLRRSDCESEQGDPRRARRPKCVSR